MSSIPVKFQLYHGTEAKGSRSTEIQRFKGEDASVTVSRAIGSLPATLSDNQDIAIVTNDDQEEVQATLQRWETSQERLAGTFQTETELYLTPELGVFARFLYTLTSPDDSSTAGGSSNE
jgi:hypothetical protein